MHIKIVELRKTETDANLVAQRIDHQLELLVAVLRAMKRAVQTPIRMGAGGIRVNVGGRLGGADIARTEWYREGRVPLHTLRAEIEYGFSEAKTTYGTIGVQVLVIKGETLGKGEQPATPPPEVEREKKPARKPGVKHAAAS